RLFHPQSCMFRLPDVTGLLLPLFDAVAVAHAQRVIHRDLKPENILLTDTGAELKPKVLDFGLSIVDRLDHQDVETAADSFAGTTPYMAPEQLQGEILSGACDVYALGQMLWELLHGRRAFEGSRFDVVMAKMNVDGLEVVRSDLPADYRDLVRRCTLLDPTSRPTAREAFDRLRALPNAVPTATNFQFQEPEGPTNTT
ncbi:MAG: serine/threonine protein kinase, partial [Planctomycetaceae bacterium]|nr:serine/threonine protein kinase [Planctomycetaceae bacterium]